MFQSDSKDSIANGFDQSVIQITDHLDQILARVTQASIRSGRSVDDIRIVAVSKSQPVEAIRQIVDAGIHDIGESYVAEALAKQAQLEDAPITWHFIGHIQANKTRSIAEHFAWVHSVDRARIAQRLSDQRPHHAPPLNVLIQVNISNEPQKSGVPPGEAEALARVIASLPRLRLRGLMAIPAPEEDAARTRASFERVHGLALELATKGLNMDTLSMGMSGDFEEAIAAGSNCVRIGTALFGPRERTAMQP
jgi:pyridoxal phosphate enzyme (YggS family)